MTDDETAALKKVWNDYLDGLKSAGEQLFRTTTPSDQTTAAEGLRHLSRLTRLGLVAMMEYADPDFPVLARYVDEVTKFGCDNPDTIYQRALINGAHRYRIVGTRNSIDYLSFITAKPGENGRQDQIGQIDTKTLKVGSEGTFEITLSPERSGENWLLMTPETKSVSVRQTYLNRATEKPADLRIERLGEAVTPPLLTLEAVKAKLAAASGYTQYCATLFTDWTESYLAHPNTLPPADQDACLRAGGDPNIYFYRSFWSLAPDEALAVHIAHIPQCDTWNLQVDNYWQESMDHRYFRSSVNKHTAWLDADGGVTIVIAHRDPGHPNWLSTAGHRLGHFAMRWIRAAEHVDPVARLISFDEARAIHGKAKA
ncbi:DUF1214 domain-containing protein [Sphingomonas immobilis]|uniref:DUF1214 domain-containing protein n=1 Tax=Sphingomonas immobilis TaxID=3063997 RepID=A0ABT8ZX42_9SPHN|nr:DUF1214 domain-containing protein [Sphingomonas sp. CA1-15]MDO7841714.1 DUF1214 domain-containing protein [Sphingomonas sp. CA1-15]